MNAQEKAGYDAWIDYWARFGWAPGPGDCPARWMTPSQDRSDYLRGWLKARAEFMNS